MQTEEYLLDGMKILQDSEQYRFTSDAVLLARFVTAKKGERVADFCSGSGVVGLHFFGENTGVEHVTLFEMQEELSEMSARTVALNGLKNFTAVCCRVQDIPPEYTEAFSLILCNPPYERGGFENADYKKALCRKELALTLPELVESAAKRLRFGGRFALCHRADRLAEVFCELKSRKIEPKRLQFVRGRAGAKPYLILVEGTKGAKEGIEILPDAVNVKN